MSKDTTLPDALKDVRENPLNLPEKIWLWKNAFHEILPYKNEGSMEYIRADIAALPPSESQLADANPVAFAVSDRFYRREAPAQALSRQISEPVIQLYAHPPTAHPETAQSADLEKARSEISRLSIELAETSFDQSAEIARLMAEREHLREGALASVKDAMALADEVEIAQNLADKHWERLAEAEKVIGFYADEDRYENGSLLADEEEAYDPVLKTYFVTVKYDTGGKARAFLAGAALRAAGGEAGS